MRRSWPWVVKLGGSHAFAPHLRDWIDALSGCGGRVVIIPGGGPFADAVRSAQPAMGFDDAAAHRMALLAMEQFGCALASLSTVLRLASSLAAIRRALDEDLVPVWCPTAMVLRAADVPWSWDITSDSLAAWLAGRLGAKRMLLVKHTQVCGEAITVGQLTERGIVDPAFGAFLAASRIEAWMAGPRDHAAAVAAISCGKAPGVPLNKIESIAHD